jgi:hypothetical protein
MRVQTPRLHFWQIINMNVGFFGIQYSFGLQQTAINPLYTFLHAKPEDLPFLNLAGPLTGLLIQPLIGAMSDRTWHPRWGRRVAGSIPKERYGDHQYDDRSAHDPGDHQLWSNLSNRAWQRSHKSH